MPKSLKYNEYCVICLQYETGHLAQHSITSVVDIAKCQRLYVCSDNLYESHSKHFDLDSSTTSVLLRPESSIIPRYYVRSK